MSPSGVSNEILGREIPAVYRMVSLMTKEEKRFLFDMANRLQARPGDGQVLEVKALAIREDA